MSDPYGQQPYGQQPYGEPSGYGQPPYSQQPWAGPSDRRPGTVTAAAVTTLVVSALTLVGGLLFVALAAAQPDSFTSGFRDSAGSSYDDVSDDDIATVVMVAGGVIAVWATAAVVLAIFALRRSKVARILLVVSSAMTILVSLVSIGSVVSVVPLLAAIAVIVLLFVGGANDWFARRTALPVGTTQPWG